MTIQDAAEFLADVHDEAERGVVSDGWVWPPTMVVAAAEALLIAMDGRLRELGTADWDALWQKLLPTTRRAPEDRRSLLEFCRLVNIHGVYMAGVDEVPEAAIKRVRSWCSAWRREQELAAGQLELAL